MVGVGGFGGKCTCLLYFVGKAYGQGVPLRKEQETAGIGFLV